MGYVLRADASRSIGAGHVMRSSSIAEELINRGEDVVFVGHISELPWVKDRIEFLGFKYIYDYFQDYIPQPQSDVLIIDSYDIPVDHSFIAPENWLRTVAIVDELTPNYSCSLRIHPGLDSNWIGNSNIPILSGPKYIPFRSSIAENLYLPNTNRETLRIAVVAGGSDPHKLVNEIARLLVTFNEEFEVILFSNDAHELTLDSRFRYVQLSQDLDKQTQNADLILTTASTSSLEFLARGFSVGIACAVDNQKQNFRVLDELGVAAPFGHYNSEKKWDLDREKIYALITSIELRENLRINARGLIDFEGARRLADAIALL
jgi:spore coat polysaccharide biosynthesis predicted glycosyltransferase SpsG